ncbi:hypothetical protein A0257_22035 [Hymenobacter psoromatis]|nr:hypothetical protein A0257_22035 [Hymenobacter psoromatis]
MLRSLYRFRRLLATTCLVMFANVLVGQCWCASPRPARTRRSVAAAHSCCQQAAADPASCCQPTACVRLTKHPPLAGRHSHSGCCRDQKASLLAKLSQPNDQGIFLPGPALLPAALALPPRPWASRWSRTQAVRLVLPRYLPPKIPDLRIFLRSLTV